MKQREKYDPKTFPFSFLASFPLPWGKRRYLDKKKSLRVKASRESTDIEKWNNKMMMEIKVFASFSTSLLLSCDKAYSVWAEALNSDAYNVQLEWESTTLTFSIILSFLYGRDRKANDRSDRSDNNNRLLEWLKWLTIDATRLLRSPWAE